MSYARFGDGDVYVWADSFLGGIRCQACRLLNDWPSGAWFENRSEMLAHLAEHKKAGHKVPQHAIERLEREIKELGDIVESIHYPTD